MALNSNKTPEQKTGDRRINVAIDHELHAEFSRIVNNLDENKFSSLRIATQAAIRDFCHKWKPTALKRVNAALTRPNFTEGKRN